MFWVRVRRRLRRATRPRVWGPTLVCVLSTFYASCRLAPAKSAYRLKIAAKAEWIACAAHASWHWLESSLKPLGTLLLLFLGALFVYYIVMELRRDIVILEPFSVPKKFEDAGITPRVMASRIGCALDELERSIQSSVGRRDAFGYSHLETTTPDIEFPQTKMGLKSVIGFFRSVSGRHTMRISGDILFTSNSGNALPTPVTITVYGAEGRDQQPGVSCIFNGNDLDGLARQAAEMALEFANPYLFGLMLDKRGRRADAIDVAMRMTGEAAKHIQNYSKSGLPLPSERQARALFRFGTKRKMERRRNGYFLWGHVLASENEELKDAIKLFRLSLRIDPDFAMGYFRCGIALTHLQDADDAKIARYRKEAIIEFQQARDISPEIAPNALIGEGYALLNLGQGQ